MNTFRHLLTTGLLFMFMWFGTAPSVWAQIITSKTLDFGNGGTTGLYTSQAIVNGTPAVAYYNQTESSLMYARNSAPDGSGSWQIVVVDYVGDVGQHCSLAVVNGSPAISYHNATGGQLMYVRALNASGTTWGPPLSVDNINGQVGRYTSLVVVDGAPAISYSNASNSSLRYVRALDASGTTWGTPITLEVNSSDNRHTSLAVVNGNPAISYCSSNILKYVCALDASGTSWGAPLTVGGVSTLDEYPSLAVVNGNPAISYRGSSTLKYVRALDVNGASWGTPITLDGIGGVGQYTSLTVVNGTPAISYCKATSGGLKYVRALDASGTTWNTPLTPDSAGLAGYYTSLAVADGNPAISYYASSGGDLKYVRALDTSGTTWPAGIVADSGTASGDSGKFTSQAVVNGNPAISYYGGSGDLIYLRALDASGTSWGTPLTLDSAGLVGYYTSLAVVNGNPAISYYDVTNGNLKYVRALDASGTSWGTPITLDITGDVGLYTSLVMVNGSPAISYYDATNSDLKYVRALDASGTSWGTPITLATLGVVGQHTSLVVVNGNPAISYYHASNSFVLKYVRALDASGTSWGTPITVDSAIPVGEYTSMAVVNGNPAISYRDSSSNYLKYVRALDASGATWGTPLTIFGTGGHYTSLMVVDGSPAISCYEPTNGDLHYARALDASGTTWGSTLTLDSTGQVGQYCSLALVNGNPAISYYEATNNNLKWVSIIATAPAVATRVAVGGTSGAVLQGTVSSNGMATDVTFQYSTNATLSSGVTTSLPQNLAGAVTGRAVNRFIDNLAAHTLYYFRASGVNSVGTTNGDILSFTTGNTPPTAPNGTTTATKGNQKTLAVTFPPTDADGDAVAIISAAAVSGLTLDSFTGTSATFTPNAGFTGSASFTYTVSDGFGGAASGTITVAVTATEALTDWRTLHFGSPLDTGLGANLFDADSDGVVNLIEFAFGLAPRSAASFQLPQPQLSGSDFIVSFTQPEGVSGITYGAERRATLESGIWTAITDTGSGNTHTFSVPVGSNTQIFIRLTVTEQ